MAGDWDFSGIVIPSAALDLYCTAGISVYAPRKNNVRYLTSGDDRSAIKIEGYARNDEALSKLRDASDFYVPHLPR